MGVTPARANLTQMPHFLRVAWQPTLIRFWRPGRTRNSVRGPGSPTDQDAAQQRRSQAGAHGLQGIPGPETWTRPGAADDLELLAEK